MVETTPQLSSNSSSNLEISAVGIKEKPIRKDKRRKDLEVRPGSYIAFLPCRMQFKQKIMKQIISLSMVSIAFDMAEMRHMNLAWITIQGWATFATWSYRYLNPKHVIQRALKLPSISHTCFFDTKLYKPLPLFAVFLCAYEVSQSPHENSMSGANTRSILARFGDNSWEKGEDFVKTFYVEKLVWEMEGSLSAPALDDV